MHKVGSLPLREAQTPSSEKNNYLLKSVLLQTFVEFNLRLKSCLYTIVHNNRTGMMISKNRQSERLQCDQEKCRGQELLDRFDITGRHK